MDQKFKMAVCAGQCLNIVLNIYRKQATVGILSSALENLLN
jgi:hypothetical protein